MTIINMDLDLLPQQALTVANERMRQAIEGPDAKYEKDDWLTNVPYTRQDLLDKIERHHTKRKAGQVSDEHGHHAAAIVCNALMLLEYELRGIGKTLTIEDIAKGLFVGRRKDFVETKDDPKKETNGVPSDKAKRSADST